MKYSSPVSYKYGDGVKFWGYVRPTNLSEAEFLPVLKQYVLTEKII
jgi:hypothetical protein